MSFGEPRWPQVQARRLFRIQRGATPRADDSYWEGQHTWLTPEDLAANDGGFVKDSRRSITNEGLASCSAELTPPGSLVVSSRAPIGYVAQTRFWTCTNQGCFTLAPRNGVDARYFRYQLLAIRPILQSLGQGSTFMELSTDALATAPLVSPPLEAQQAIADFLDRETARIDELILGKGRLIELVLSRVWVSFSRFLDAVHRVAPLRRVLTQIHDGPFGSAFTSGQYTSEGAFVVRLGNIGFAEFRRDESAFIPLDLYAKFIKHRVQEGDLLIAGLGDDTNHAGRACVAPDLGPAIVKGKCFCAKVNKGVADAKYVALFLSSPMGAQEVSAAVRGSTRSMINLDLARNVKLPLPPLDIQQRVVAAVEIDREKANNLVTRVRRHVAVLHERRQALITAAVTGAVQC